MTTVPIDLAAIAASANLRCLVEDGAARFMIRGETATVVAQYRDGAVNLFTERDVGHRKLLAVLQP